MLRLLKALLVKFAFVRWLLGAFGSLAALLPVALLLLKFGWPLLIILAVFALPLMIFLAVLGLPIIAVLAVAALVLGAVAMLIPFAVLAFKFFVFVVLPVWVLWKIAGWVFRSGRGRPPAPPAPPGSPPPPPPMAPTPPPPPPPGDFRPFEA